MKISNFGIILYPSTRSLAYLHMLSTNNILPKEAIVMGKWPFLPNDILLEAKKYSYAEKYFSLNDNLELLIKHKDINLSLIDSTDINSQEIREALSKAECKNFIFTGGGILKKEVLSLDIDFIHVHPGDINYYRGSTCFHYSYLNKQSVSCTTFIMRKELDRGEVLDISHIHQNIFIENDQSFFIDYIYDPFIRSISLKKLFPHLENLKKKKKIRINKFYGHDHYVIHPVLRSLFIKKINNSYRMNDKKGIYIIDA